ncbi:PDR/VanB family oxidoreductase [Falsiroseomonas tokyonensis]|uniref:PDR/VanB family oxidoreductase n=1 Tax=Falsiroseomonas tokyonensis TaxID=430521 RepID=A0ABV7BYW2_9PROT|nr:PDR/VanB family oxidoreductase [Falsiroseomonas tokyonensis]MBU8539616.1 oxidoreductase [Falsiroseomonas tokyonensis]
MEESFTDLRVLAARPIAEEIFGFELAHPAGQPLPAFTAGAHIWVRGPGGEDRRYSLCSDPAETAFYSIAVKRDAAGRGGSVALCDQVRAGDLLPCSAPRNDFPLVGRPVARLFIAGGIGITPIMAMIRQLEAEGGPPWKLVYLTRSAAQTAFREELQAFRGKVTIHHDGGDPDRAFDLWPLLEQPKGRHIHCCGPRGLMQAVRDMTGHWSSAAVHFEDFGAGAGQNRPDDQPFTARLVRSGVELTVPAGTTLLSALHAAGHAVPFSCESGTCGSCRTGLVSGEVDHRDLVLMEHEKAMAIMPCVSRAAPGCPTLVLDL